MKPFCFIHSYLKASIIAVLLFCVWPCFSQTKGKQVPQKNKAWLVALPGDVKVPMIWVDPATFTMGSPATEKGHKADESLQTTVTITKGFWLGKTELTIGQWKALTGMNVRDKVMKMLSDETLYDFNGKQQKIRDFMNFDPANPDKIMVNENDEMPMYFVSWNEAMDFCRQLTKQEQAAGRLPAGYAYTLPTEAQWELACRGIKGNRVDTSTVDLNTVAWYNKTSAIGYTGRGLGKPLAGPRNVGQKLPNALGLQDMLGNLWEWCRDWYGPLPGGNLVDPGGPATGGFKANKGGSWGSGANDQRAANRAQNPPNEDSAYRGFRIALCALQ
ncbi:MAG: formylglycine-generating enzyme family protein [Bacteroidota bacterium]